MWTGCSGLPCEFDLPKGVRLLYCLEMGYYIQVSYFHLCAWHQDSSLPLLERVSTSQGGTAAATATDPHRGFLQPAASSNHDADTQSPPERPQLVAASCVMLLCHCRRDSATVLGGAAKALPGVAGPSLTVITSTSGIAVCGFACPEAKMMTRNTRAIALSRLVSNFVSTQFKLQMLFQATGALLLRLVRRIDCYCRLGACWP